jgi:hypothetical protein
MYSLTSFVVIVAAALALPGCIYRGNGVALPAADGSDRVVIHVVGWNGPTNGDRDLLVALREAGVTSELRTYDWTNGHRSLMALWHAQHSSKPAKQLAAYLQELKSDQKRIDLIADSSGCGVVLDALAQLPADVKVRAVVLSSPAVSSGYDLRPALASVEKGIYSFNSDRDWIILGIGTRIFGTVDGRHTAGAGKVGFRIDPLDPAYGKLHQISYDAAWKQTYGHTGQHTHALLPTFAKAKLAPLLLE